MWIYAYIIRSMPVEAYANGSITSMSRSFLDIFEVRCVRSGIWKNAEFLTDIE